VIDFDLLDFEDDRGFIACGTMHEGLLIKILVEWLSLSNSAAKGVLPETFIFRAGAP
jgi:hypothetical protein